jgi:hypothetical protein
MVMARYEKLSINCMMTMILYAMVPTSMNQMRISTNDISLVMLRLKNLEIRNNTLKS